MSGAVRVEPDLPDARPGGQLTHQAPREASLTRKRPENGRTSREHYTSLTEHFIILCNFYVIDCCPMKGSWCRSFRSFSIMLLQMSITRVENYATKYSTFVSELNFIVESNIYILQKSSTL